MATLMVVVGFLVVLALLGCVALLVCVVLDEIETSAERARVERATAEASWQIHQRATAAFAQMLEAAREEPSSRSDR
jgi:hypothetical protein